MSIFNKILDFFTEDVDDEIELEKETEKKNLNKELMEERKKYNKKSIDSKSILEVEKEVPEKKQVLFFDKDFERKENPVQPQEESSLKYKDTSNKKFKPSSYISPVHGLLKEADDVVEFKSETKTISESDYSVIRKRVFGNDVFLDELVEDNDSKLFATEEIIDLHKRMQIDNEPALDKNLTVEEAYEIAAKENVKINSKTYTESDESSQYMFDLLNELKDGSENE
ncbi:MAG: hypothetical protein ACK5NF_01760 [Bacilli bacterium]